MKYAELILNNEAARCMLCADAPCTATCPGGYDPAEFIRAARFENAAVGAGYIDSAKCAECPGKCESACLHYEAPIKIREMAAAAPEPVKSEELTADLSMEFCRVKCENPFFLSSSVVASGYEMCANALRAGWGGIVYKTIGFIKPDEVSPRFDAIGKESTPFVGFKNLEQISDHPLKENLEILRKLKEDFPTNIIVSSIMGSTEEEWTELARLSEEAGCDIIECNFSCPQMVGEGLGSDVGQNPELVRAYTTAAKRGTKLPVLAKMTPNIGNMEVPAIAAKEGGADANENAIKMARMYTGRKKIFSRYRSYHGSTFGAGNLTGEPRRYPLEPGIPGFVKFFDPYMYRDNLPFATEKECSDFYVNKLREQVIYEGPDSVAAIVMETITGSNGVIIPPEGYLAGVRKICDDYGIMMICDEVMAGFGRTGKMFAFENFGVKPDIVSFAKGVTCGYVQFVGVAVSKKIAEYFDDNVLQCGLTYSGHPLACAAGVACLNYYKDNNILDNVNKSGNVLGEILEELKTKHKCVGDVRCIGLFSAIELVKDKDTRGALVPYGGDKLGVMGGIIGKLKAKKFMTYSHENMILICPPLIITPEQLREEMVKVDEVLTEVDATL